MDTPFVLVDTNTGFHLGSCNIKALQSEANSRSALAVLCSSVLLQWRCVVEEEKSSRVDTAPCSFEVADTVSSGADGRVRVFRSRDGYLAVVFADTRHDVYACYAEALVDEVAQGRLAPLKKVAGLQECARRALAAAAEQVMTKASITDFAVLGKGAGSRLEISRGQFKKGHRFDLSELESLTTSGVFVTGGVMYTIAGREATVVVVAVKSGTDVPLDLVDVEGVLFSWVLSLCSRNDTLNTREKQE